jgi:membrane protease YdiL (CAAX protease family)
MSRLKREPTEARKVGCYKFLCTWLWIATLIALAVVGWRPLFTIQTASGEIAWLEHAWVRYLVAAVIALLAVGILLPVAIVLWKKLNRIPRKYGSADALKSLSYFLPATWTERRWYAAVSITAGICEEILFRGFLLRYLHETPWNLNLTLALLISAVIFGIQHLYQRVKGAAGTVVLGFLFGLLFLLTGSLLAPMLLHAALDLRMLVLVRPPATQIAEAAAGV